MFTVSYTRFNNKVLVLIWVLSYFYYCLNMLCVQKWQRYAPSVSLNWPGSINKTCQQLESSLYLCWRSDSVFFFAVSLLSN